MLCEHLCDVRADSQLCFRSILPAEGPGGISISPLWPLCTPQSPLKRFFSEFLQEIPVGRTSLFFGLCGALVLCKACSNRAQTPACGRMLLIILNFKSAPLAGPQAREESFQGVTGESREGIRGKSKSPLPSLGGDRSFDLLWISKEESEKFL